MTGDNSKNIIFSRIDGLVEQFEQEGYPFAYIVEVLRDYIELSDDFLL
jgi:hypothetical protein